MNRVASEVWPKDTEFKIICVPEFALRLGEYRYLQRAQVQELRQSALGAANAAVTLAKEWNADLIVRVRMAGEDSTAG